MKKLIICLIGFCVVPWLFQSCTFDVQKPFNIQFSSEDLSNLILNRDTLSLKKNILEQYHDTVVFLHDDMDTVKCNVNTYVYVTEGSFANKSISPYYIKGVSNYDFDTNDSLTMHVEIYRMDDNEGLHKSFYVLNKQVTQPYESTSYYSTTATIPVDTATILGKTYNDVYKLDTSGDPIYKKIYFAKNYGYIYVEFSNGQNLKLVKVDSPK